MNEISLTDTAYPHVYWGYDLRVLHILTGTEDMTHGYCIASRVLRIYSRILMIWLMGNAYPHWYCILSRVLHIVYTGWSHLDLPTLSFFLGGPSCCKSPLKVSIIFIQLASSPNFLADCSSLLDNVYDIYNPFPHRLFSAN